VVDMACADMAIHTETYGVYRRSRLTTIECAVKEMGYTALHDRPEKETVLPRKKPLCLGACVQRPDLTSMTRCCISRRHWVLLNSRDS
jgi:predicted ATP-grasp superfamily ATP-dependent carboligase